MLSPELRHAAQAALELRRRQTAYPLAYAGLWDRPPPRTSQRRALATVAHSPLLTLILGGNRTGKSEVVAMWMVANAAGLDAVHEGPEGRVEWVRRWLARNALPETLIPKGPGRVWSGSPTFAAACEQIRPKLKRWSPEGSRYLRWEQSAEAELRLPGSDGVTGVIVSKAYKQYDQDPQSWEGANVRAIGLDEQPNSHNNLAAAFSRLIDQAGKVVMSLTPLRGKNDWLYRDLVQPAPSYLRVVNLHGADNPHIPQDVRAMTLAAFPAWQRASRDVGAFTQPEGAIWSFDRGVHVVDPFPIPEHWTRFQGIDWGVRSPHVLWAAEVPGAFTTPEGRTYQAGSLLVYRELAPRRSTLEPGIPPKRLLEWSKELEDGDERLGHCTVYRVGDVNDPVAFDDAGALGLWIAHAEKGPGSVLPGIELVEALLSTVDGVTLEPHEPRLYVFRTCPALIEEIEGYRWAEVREGSDPKPDPVCSDHGPDALRYLVRHRQALGFR